MPILMRRFVNPHRPGVRRWRAARPGRRAGLARAVADLRGAARPQGPRDARRRPSTTSPSLGVHSHARRALLARRRARARLARQAEVRRDRSRRATTGAPTTRSSTRHQGARLAAAADRLGPGAAVGHQRRTRHASRARARPSSRSSCTPSATHYGAKVDTWSIWNEPNQPQFLLPQYSRAHDAAVAGDLPQALLRRPARPGRRRPGVAKPVLLGETSPRGTGKVVAPLTFLRGALCLDSQATTRPRSAARSVTATGYAHHAYTTRPGPDLPARRSPTT